jgi:hypothetical protein
MSNAIPTQTALRARGYSAGLLSAMHSAFDGDLITFKLAMSRTVIFSFAARSWVERSPEGEIFGSFDMTAAVRLEKMLKK